MATIELENITKEYDSVRAVDDLNVSIEDGELLVVVGPSGSGKSTLIRILADLTEPTSGTIRFGSRDVTGIPTEERDVSMVFQDLALYPHMTAFENVAFPLKANDPPAKGEIRDRVEHVSELVNCDHILAKRIPELSGGQQQRVALARALIREPEVFLLDEPFSDLDELLKRTLRTDVLELQRELDITMVHVTHDQEEAMTIGDRILVMNNGQIQQLDEPETVFSEPQSLFVANFIGSPQINNFTCDVEGAEDGTVLFKHDTFTVSFPESEFGSKSVSEEATVCVRPQNFVWSEHPTESDLKIAIPVEVSVTETIGTEDIVHCYTDGGEEIKSVVSTGEVEEGSSGYLSADVSDLLIFDGTDRGAERLTLSSRQLATR